MTKSVRLLLLTLSFAGCARAPGAASKPPVVLISVDTLRADHLPAYGYRGVSTPAIDALARDSTVFENAYSNVPLTLPSHAAILTGLLPYENGVRDNIGFRLSPAHRTLAEILRSRSYSTGAAVSSFVLRADRRLAAGFDSYDDSGEDNPTRERSGTDSAAALAKWAAGVKAKPLFLFLHIYEPHVPYSPPEPYKTRYASSPYDGEIATADAAVGSFVGFLKRAGLYDRAVLVFLSDHGEGLGDHGESEHGVFLYREALRVPLFLKLPGGRGQERVAAPVSLTDVVPTVLSLLSIPVPADLHGVSLLSADPQGGRRIYSETFYPRLDLGWSDLASLAGERYHYIQAPRPELYDLASDPAERKDLAPDLPPAFRSMRAALTAIDRPFSMPEASSSEELKKLAALGYINVSPGRPSEGPLPDPKDKVEALRQLKRLFDLYYAAQYEEAARSARSFVAAESRVLSAWNILSDSLDHTGRLPEAIEALRKGIDLSPAESESEQLSQAYENLYLLQKRARDGPGQERTLRGAVARGVATEAIKRELARLLLASGKAADAAALLKTGAPPKEVESLEVLGVALAAAGNSAEARNAFLAALAIEPGNARVAFNLGTLLLREGDSIGARDWFSKSVEADSNAAATWSQLGNVQAKLGDPGGAAESWRKALELDPRQYNSLYNLAVWEAGSGRGENARRNLERFVAAAPPERYAGQISQARRILRELKARTRPAKP